MSPFRAEAASFSRDFLVNFKLWIGGELRAIAIAMRL
jgi:hypothetical protein